MKVKLLYIVIAILLIGSTNAKRDIRVVYKIASKPLSEKVIKKFKENSPKVYKTLNDLTELRNQLNFNLDITNNESFYYCDVKGSKSISNKKGYNAVIQSFANSYVYKKTDEKIIIEQLISEEVFLLSSSTEKFKWKLHNERKLINGYNCFKATTEQVSKKIINRKNIIITAWYCPELNFSSGPKDYCGLPGLILELNTGKLTYFATKIEFNPSNLIVKRPKKGKEMAEEEYIKRLPNITKDNVKEYFEK